MRFEPLAKEMDRVPRSFCTQNLKFLENYNVTNVHVVHSQQPSIDQCDDHWEV